MNDSHILLCRWLMCHYFTFTIWPVSGKSMQHLCQKAKTQAKSVIELTCQRQQTLITTTTIHSSREQKNYCWNNSWLFWTTDPPHFPPSLHPSISSALFWLRYDITDIHPCFLLLYIQSWITPIKVRLVFLTLSLPPTPHPPHPPTDPLLIFLPSTQNE